jgi:putative sterol carrier protein
MEVPTLAIDATVTRSIAIQCRCDSRPDRNGGLRKDMTWQGGKKPRESRPAAFAPLTALAKEQDGPEQTLGNLAKALSNFATPVRLNVRLLRNKTDESVEHWEVEGGSKDAKATRNEPKNPDVVLVMRPETLAQIARGELAPYDALFGGRMRVGGNFELGKAITKHLTNPAATYLSPCS